jgi:hypothetical protein
MRFRNVLKAAWGTVCFGIGLAALVHIANVYASL